MFDLFESLTSVGPLYKEIGSLYLVSSRVLSVDSITQPGRSLYADEQQKLRSTSELILFDGSLHFGRIVFLAHVFIVVLAVVFSRLQFNSA